MTDIDIERWRKAAEHTEESFYWNDDQEPHHRTVLMLIERVEKAEAQRDQLQDRLTCMCGDDIDRHPYGDGHSPVSMRDYYRAEFVEMEQKLVAFEAQRDRMKEAIVKELNEARSLSDRIIGNTELADRIMAVINSENKTDE